jgi:signal transduction histidine kinase
MVRRADEWREHDLSRRFDLGKPVDELTELGNTLDQMLDRIATALRTERRLTDEVAHELRTPLAVIRSEAQLALLSPEDSGPRRDAFGAIIEATEQMDGSITTMLAVARSANSAGESCDVTEVIDRAVNESTARPGIVVTAEPPSAVLSVDAPPPVVKAALAPLVDNALRHARSRVRIDAHAANGRVIVTVEDDGPGVADEQRHSIFDPGHSTVQGGAGLGLPLARRLASSIGAELHDRSHGQGLFVLDLPRSE